MDYKKWALELIWANPDGSKYMQTVDYQTLKEAEEAYDNYCKIYSEVHLIELRVIKNILKSNIK
jgi:hypothetical protein